MVVFCNSLPYFNAHKAGLFIDLQDEHEIHLLSGEANDDAQKEKLPSNINLIRFGLSRYKHFAFKDIEALIISFQTLRRIRPERVVSFTMKSNLLAGFAVFLHNTLGGNRPQLTLVYPGLGRIFDRQGEGFLYNLRQKLILFIFRFLFKMTNGQAVFENEDSRRFWFENNVLAEEHCWLKKGTGVPISKTHEPKKKIGPLVVVFASRLLKAKGVSVFIEAARELENNKGIKFVMFGGADVSEADAVDLTKTVFPSNLDFKGDHDIEVILTALETAHCVCLPTRYMEGVPRILLEGASKKCALVASNVSGCNDIIRHQENGILLDATSEKSLQDDLVFALENLSKNRLKCIEMGESAETFLRENGYDSTSVKLFFEKLLVSDVGGKFR